MCSVDWACSIPLLLAHSWWSTRTTWERWCQDKWHLSNCELCVPIATVGLLLQMKLHLLCLSSVLHFDLLLHYFKRPTSILVRTCIKLTPTSPHPQPPPTPPQQKPLTEMLNNTIVIAPISRPPPRHTQIGAISNCTRHIGLVSFKRKHTHIHTLIRHTFRSLLNTKLICPNWSIWLFGPSTWLSSPFSPLFSLIFLIFSIFILGSLSLSL